MINYKIVEISPLNERLQIEYTKEGCEPYYYMEGLPPTYTAEGLAEIAEDRVWHATQFWDFIEAKSQIEVSEELFIQGSIKDHVYTDAPSYDVSTQKLVDVVTEDETTVYHSKVVESLSVEEITQILREKRTALLSATDNWGIADRGMSDEMRTYRQALRDLPQQEGFPDTIIWPIRPLD
jgi:hypothetical protein